MSIQYPVSYLIGRTRALLLGTTRTQLNQLGAVCQTGDSQITISVNPSQSGPGMIEAGDVVAIDDELLYITSVAGQSSNSTANVLRGFYGSSPAQHANAAVIYINPYYSQFQIRQTLMDEIRSWGPQVYAVKTIDLSTTDLVNGYDMGALAQGEWYGVLRVTISPDTLVGQTDDKSWPDIGWEVQQSANLTDFPSGNALIITQPGAIFDSPRTLHVVFAAPFNVDQTDGAGNPTFQDTDDLINTVGLDLSDLDIPPLGAAWRLLLNSELRRDLIEPMGSSTDLQGYQQTASMRVADQLKELRDSRLRDAERLLKAKYPLMRV